MATPFLVFGGLEVRVTDWRRGEDERGGEPKRTLSGQLRGVPLWTARRWTCTAYAESDAAATALRAKCDGLTPQAASGAGLPGALSLIGRVTADDYVPEGDTAWYRVLSIELTEAL